MMVFLGGGGDFILFGTLTGDGGYNFFFSSSWLWLCLGTRTAPADFLWEFFFLEVTFYASEAQQDDTHQRSERLSLCFDFVFFLSFFVSLSLSLVVGTT